MDVRSAFHRAFGRRNFAKNNEVYGDISWPARSPIRLVLISLYGSALKEECFWHIRQNYTLSN
jgi:hypothetical protein